MNLAQQRKHHCYGDKAALCIEAVISEAKTPTVNLELARKLSGAQGTFDWANKVVIQPAARDLPLLAGMFLGYLPRCNFTRPGKAITFERQPNRIFVSAIAGQQRYALPITIGDTVYLSALVLTQLQQSCSSDATILPSIIRGACALYQERAS